MKAIVYTRYGSPDVVSLQDVPKPLPKKTEVCVRIHATTVNRTDCGAEVTATCATQHVDLVKSLGADDVIDYIHEDFSRRDKMYDVIFDAVGKSSFGKCKPILTKHGIYMSTELGYMSQNPLLAITRSFSRGKKVLFPIPSICKEDVVFLKELVDSGHYKPIIDRNYALHEVADAYRYIETGMKTGNVVISI